MGISVTYVTYDLLSNVPFSAFLLFLCFFLTFNNHFINCGCQRTFILYCQTLCLINLICVANQCVCFTYKNRIKFMFAWIYVMYVSSFTRKSDDAFPLKNVIIAHGEWVFFSSFFGNVWKSVCVTTILDLIILRMIEICTLY